MVPTVPSPRVETPGSTRSSDPHGSNRRTPTNRSKSESNEHTVAWCSIARAARWPSFTKFPGRTGSSEKLTEHTDVVWSGGHDHRSRLSQPVINHIQGKLGRCGNAHDPGIRNNPYKPEDRHPCKPDSPLTRQHRCEPVPRLLVERRVTVCCVDQDVRVNQGCHLRISSFRASSSSSMSAPGRLA